MGVARPKGGLQRRFKVEAAEALVSQRPAPEIRTQNTGDPQTPPLYCTCIHSSVERIRGRLWAMNKREWPWLMLGILGAIVAGAIAPVEGVFIAQVQVSRLAHTHAQNPYAVCLGGNNSRACIRERSRQNMPCAKCLRTTWISARMYSWVVGVLHTIDDATRSTELPPQNNSVLESVYELFLPHVTLVLANILVGATGAT